MVKGQKAMRQALAPLAQAQRLLAAGQHAQAAALLRPAVDHPLLRAEAHYLLAIASIMAGDPSTAVAQAGVAVAATPGDARYHFTLGRAHKAAGDLDGAESAYRHALALNPAYAEAMVSLGIVMKTRGDANAAITLCDQALALVPTLAAAHANRAAALALRTERAAEAGQDDAPSDEVIAAQVHAVALEPRNAALQRNLGVLLMRARRRREAATAFNAALTENPADVESCLNLGFCLRALGQNTLVRELFEKWLSVNAPNAVVMRSLASVLTRDGHIDAARPWAEQAAALDLDAPALMQLGGTLLQSRRQAEALANCRRAVEMSGARPDLYGTLLLGMNYLHEDPQVIFDAHAEFGRLLPPVLASRPAWKALAPGERLKVGYVSGDFVRHSVSFFISALLERHDTTRFEITCYHNLGWSDATTERLKSLGHRWVECDGLSDAHLRRRIEDDGIHILIDLAGHTSHSRVHMFAQGAAPVQITYLGYPTVNGVPANEFRITDAVIDPGDMPTCASEQPLHLPHTMFCYRPDQAPPIGPPPEAGCGHITFGSFNNIAKVTDRTLALWAQAMNAVPGSCLLLKSPAMAQASNRDNIERFMAARGVAAERLSLQPWIASKSSHLELYNQVDIALDPYPYNGATTTCEALWMGVPVLSLRGRTHTSRMGASLLHAIGRPEWVADSDAEFVDKACQLAADRDARARWRTEARRVLQASALCDEVGHTAAFEALLEAAWFTVGARSTSQPQPPPGAGRPNGLN